ncbi:ABC transporter related protein [Coriobacterium glomerans PW2]|uniref:ABC transporter related protein n=1 Tax=Coriobacterium glomerans (strain ATCC 49209 / DSM 20642 / JCM 10262 / PW2) TaxID=700015 RepID=F2NBN8_CORGP|nr:energy-coupling factor transporter ATPase [Coriobacterium glomerans]AEB06847.1 ABC transporter related protein [Coriobacterium glomerans PW2]
MQPVISLNRVSYSYAGQDTRALDAVDLAIDPGDFVGIVGPSGSGKSTLARVMSGAIPHHFDGDFYGAALIDGSDSCEISLTDISRTVGSVSEDVDAQMVATSVEDEMLFGLENFAVARDEIETRIQWALELVGIVDLRGREIATLSGGQLQKVAIASILALRPRVLVLDEPCAALDPASAREVFGALAEINREAGVTVAVIEQAVATLSEFCRSILVMDAGRIALAGTTREVFAREAELRRIGVESPRVTRVFSGLAKRGLCHPEDVCLSVAEARSMIERIAAGAEREPMRLSSEHRRRRTRSERESEEKKARRDAPAKSASAPVLVLEGVSYSYPSTGALVRDLDLEVHPGEIAAIVGRNGAGKTTLTKLVSGLIRPKSGRIVLAGHDTRDMAVSQIAGYAATLFQNPDHQICRNTVLAEVCFGLELRGISKREAHRRAREVIGDLDLVETANPFSLPRGSRQMVALASVIVMASKLIVLDEPTSGLDRRARMIVMESVRRMARRGSAVLMVCHDMEVVSDIADRVIVMADGSIARDDAAADVLADRTALARSRVIPPQIVDLADSLAQAGMPDFAGAREPCDIIDTVEELISRA